MKSLLAAAFLLSAATLPGASRMEAGSSGETWKYAVVVSRSANADPSWRAVADALAAKYAKPPFSSCVVVSDPVQAAQQQAVLTARAAGEGVRLTFKALADIEAKADRVEEVHIVHPYGILLPRRGAAYRVDGDTKGIAVTAADDFALVTAWPALKRGDSVDIILHASDGRP